MQLPQVTGYNLDRKKMNFPRDFTGQVNLVFIAFEQWHQRQVDSWVPFVEEVAADTPEFAYYEFPTIRRMNVLARTFINEGMRAGIPDPQTRARTVTLYLNKRSFRQSLQIVSEKEIVVVLFTRDGRELWRTTGAFSPQKGAALRDFLSHDETATGGAA